MGGFGVVCSASEWFVDHWATTLPEIMIKMRTLILLYNYWAWNNFKSNPFLLGFFPQKTLVNVPTLQWNKLRFWQVGSNGARMPSPVQRYLCGVISRAGSSCDLPHSSDITVQAYLFFITFFLLIPSSHFCFVLWTVHVCAINNKKGKQLGPLSGSAG